MSVALAEVRERHDCSKVHPGKRHQEWMNTEPVKHVKEDMFDEGRMKDIYTLDSEGKSAQEIAKRLNLRVSTVKSILGEQVETLHEFSDSQIAQLKKDYAPLKGKTISGTNANKLMKIFDKFDKNKQLLIKLLKANIPFVSMLAQARLISRHGANASQLAQMRKEELSEGKWKISGVTGYKNVSPQDRFEMIISATSKQDAERKWEKELDKHRAKRHIGPRGGGSCEDMDDIDIQPAGPRDSVGDIEASMTHSYDPSYGVKKETIDAGEVSKMKDKKKEVDFKTANVSTTETIDAGEVSKMADKKKEVKFSTANVSTTEDKKDPKKEVIGSEKPEPTANLENTIRNIWNKAANETTERGDSVLLPTRNESKIPPIKPDNKPGVKIAKIRATRDKEDGPADGAKDPTAMEKQILTLQGQVNVLKAKLENEKGKVVKPVADKETGQVPLTVGLAHKLLKDKAEKEEDKEVKKEAVSPYKLKYETLRARLKEKAEKEKLAKKKDEPTKGRTMTGNPATKVNTDPEINYNQ